MKNLILKKWMLVVAFLIVGWTARAQTLTPPSAGDGTAGNPYQIATLDNLYWLSQTPAAWDANNNFIQTADIDATSTTSWDGGKGFKPIGSSNPRFDANYDGNGKSISNLFINRPLEDAVGLFAVTTAKVSNLTLINANITGRNFVGALVGYQNYGTVKRCSSSGVVSGTGYVGGLIGYANENIEQSYSSANVSVASSRGGGLCGSFEFSGSFYVKNCYATGSVTGSASAQNLGGLIGSVAANNPSISTIQYCYSTGAVSATAGTDLGGLIGSLTDATVNGCYWDTQTSTMATSAEGTPKTTAEMQTQSTFIDWDFELIWAINGNNYPSFDFSRLPTFGGGAGTVANPYLISSYKHLTQLYQFPELWGASFSQTSNIDASASATTPYNAIGTDPAFTGTYNGNDYSIDGLTNAFVYDAGGLFANIKTATIRNTNLTNANISSLYMVGGIVGYAEASTITNCSVTGRISAVFAAGGVVGGASNTNINKCSANVVVGGLTMFGETYNTHFGGLVGLVNDVGTPITTISNSFAQGMVSAYNFVGGLVGGVDMASSAFGGGGTPSNLMGFSMTNCYAANILIASGGTTGGVLGQSNYFNSNNAITITNSFWDTEVSGTSTSYIGGTGKTTAEMKTQSTFTGWNFTTPIWSIKSTYNNGYPNLNGKAESISYTWNGSTDDRWNTASNWTPEGVPAAADIVTIPGTGSGVTNWPVVNEAPATPAVCNNLDIMSGAVVTIAAGKALTVNGILTNHAGITGLVVRSTSDTFDGTGALINGTASVLGTVERFVSGDIWHLVSPAATAGETVASFVDLANGNLIARNGNNYALSPYLEATGLWDYYKVSGANTAGLFGTPAKGMQVLRASGVGTGNGTAGGSGKLTFKGMLAATNQDITITKTSSGWNLVGNPYPCAIDIDAFLAANVSSLDPSYLFAYVSKVGDVSAYGYDPTSGTTLSSGEGFFVKSRDGGETLHFTMAMKSLTSDGYKSATVGSPIIKLKVEDGYEKLSTTIKYVQGATTGLDPGKDAGLFKDGSLYFSLFTRLVQDNGVDFTIQALPDNNYESMVVPVGVVADKGSNLTFKATTLNFPANYKVTLEDKATGTFANLNDANSSYAVTLDTKLSGTGRFYLHMNGIVSSVGDLALQGKLTAFAVRDVEVRVVGEVGDGAVATLFNGLGQVVLTKKLGAGSLNIIGLPNLNSGVYLLNINDKGTTQTIKVMVRK